MKINTKMIAESLEYLNEFQMEQGSESWEKEVDCMVAIKEIIEKYGIDAKLAEKIANELIDGPIDDFTDYVFERAVSQYD